MTEPKENVAAGYYDCRVIAVNRSLRKGDDKHYILSVGLIPTEGECEKQGIVNPQTYWAELPLVYVVGADYRFYDREKNVSVTRKCVAKDTSEAVEYAARVFPAWERFVAENCGGSVNGEAIKWFQGEEIRSAIVRASFKEPREWNGKYYYQATLLAARGQKEIVDNDFDRMFGASLKAAGNRFKAGAGKPVAAGTVAPGEPTAPAPSAPAPKAPSAPAPAPAAKPDKDRPNTCDAAYDAWCEKNGTDRDPEWWNLVDRVLGKGGDLSGYRKYTSEEWSKVLAEIAAMTTSVHAAEEDAMPF